MRQDEAVLIDDLNEALRHRPANGGKPINAVVRGQGITGNRRGHEATRVLGHSPALNESIADDIGDIVYPPHAIDFYSAALARSVDVHRVRERVPKIVLDYSHGAASIVMPSVLAKLGADVLAVNPFSSTGLAIARRDRREQVERIASLVRVSGSDLGYVVEPGGADGIEGMSPQRTAAEIGQQLVGAAPEAGAAPGGEQDGDALGHGPSLGRSRGRWA